MTTDPDEKPGGNEGPEGGEELDDEGDRPTVAPPFDPVAFAKEVLGGKPSPPPGTLPATAPPTAVRRPTPRGLLSLANARIPSNLPPRNPVPERKESTNNIGAVDKEWEDLATSPPPPLQQELIDAMARAENVPPTKKAGAGTGSASGENVGPRKKTGAGLVVAPPPTPGEARSLSPERVRSVAPVPPTPQEMNDRVSLGDYTGALEIAEKLLVIDPNDEPVKAVAESCRGVLRQMYTARIGPLDRVPMVMVARDQMRWLSIDHRAGFVLSLVDGVSSLEMILDVSGMPELDALRILSELAQQRIVAFR